jgi:hypothetical protein
VTQPETRADRVVGVVGAVLFFALLIGVPRVLDTVNTSCSARAGQRWVRAEDYDYSRRLPAGLDTRKARLSFILYHRYPSAEAWASAKPTTTWWCFGKDSRPEPNPVYLFNVVMQVNPFGATVVAVDAFLDLAEDSAS